MAVLFIAGLHVPMMLLVDVTGRAGIEAPAQYGPTELNTGTVFGVIVIVREAVVAHWPELGVNVYVVVLVLLIAGLHVPVTLFKDIVGNAGIVAPEQYGPTALNEGVTI